LSGDEGSERTASAPFFETPSFAAFRGAGAISDRGSRQAAGLRLPGGVGRGTTPAACLARRENFLSQRQLPKRLSPCDGFFFWRWVETISPQHDALCTSLRGDPMIIQWLFLQGNGRAFVRGAMPFESVVQMPHAFSALFRSHFETY